MSTIRSRSLIDDLIEIKDQLKSDSASGYEELQRRDRRIGIELEYLKQTPVKQIQAWLDQVSNPKHSDPASRITHSKTVISTLVVVAGIAIGLSTALALFYYTGQQPINIINVLAIGVGLQLLLLVVFILALFSRSRWLNNLLSGFNAGRWVARLAYLIPSMKNSLDRLLDWKNGVDEKIIKWQTVLWSQQFALAFNFALIVCCLYLVSFSDLAFGWSTTLAIDSSVIKKITDTLSLPWLQLFPSAVPSAELIDATRFYRLKTITLGDEQSALINQAQLAGSWWRFLLMCLLFYGLAPRIITYVAAHIKLVSSINKSILAIPGLHLLLDRMNHPIVATNAETPEVTHNIEQSYRTQQITPLSGRQSYIAHWGQPAVDKQILISWLSAALGVEAIKFNTVANISGENLSQFDNLPALNKRQAMTVLVKAWEPPTLELTDWLNDLRQHYSHEKLIVLVAYDISNDSNIASASAQDTKTWQDFLTRQKADHIEFHGATT